MGLRRLTPEMLPPHYLFKNHLPRSTVHHTYPEHWTEKEMDQHRYDDCPCRPTMVQSISPCGHDHGGYRWTVYHRSFS